MKTCSRALRLRLGQRFTFQQVNDPKHTVKTTQEWLRDKFVNVLEWPSQILDLNTIKHLWRDLKIAVHRCSPNQAELHRICREKSFCLNKVLSKGPKYLCKYDIFLVNRFAEISVLQKFVWALSLWGIVCRLMRKMKKMNLINFRKRL